MINLEQALFVAVIFMIGVLIGCLWSDRRSNKKGKIFVYPEEDRILLGFQTYVPSENFLNMKSATFDVEVKDNSQAKHS